MGFMMGDDIFHDYLGFSPYVLFFFKAGNPVCFDMIAINVKIFSKTVTYDFFEIQVLINEYCERVDSRASFQEDTHQFH